MAQLLDEVAWGAAGLVPAVAQDHLDGRVLMLAWMNREALAATIDRGEAVYWSRSRQCLWHKGQESGCIQQVKDIFIDCDNDTLVLVVKQHGSGACHTGAYSCFFRKLERDRWQPGEIPVYHAARAE